MQQLNRQEQPHKVTITNVIKEIKKFKIEGHGIILSIDGNEKFTQTQGGIAKLYTECEICDPFAHHHNDQRNSKAHIRG